MCTPSTRVRLLQGTVFHPNHALPPVLLAVCGARFQRWVWGNHGVIDGRQGGIGGCDRAVAGKRKSDDRLSSTPAARVADKSVCMPSMSCNFASAFWPAFAMVTERHLGRTHAICRATRHEAGDSMAGTPVATPPRTGAASQRRLHVWSHAPPCRGMVSFAHNASRIRPGDIGSRLSRTPMAR